MFSTLIINIVKSFKKKFKRQFKEEFLNMAYGKQLKTFDYLRL